MSATTDLLRVPVTDHQVGRLEVLGHDLAVDGDALVFTTAAAERFVHNVADLFRCCGIAPVEEYVADQLEQLILAELDPEDS